MHMYPGPAAFGPWWWNPGSYWTTPSCKHVGFADPTEARTHHNPPPPRLPPGNSTICGVSCYTGCCSIAVTQRSHCCRTASAAPCKANHNTAWQMPADARVAAAAGGNRTQHSTAWQAAPTSCCKHGCCCSCCSQTTTATTTLPAGAVGGDGGHILCRHRKGWQQAWTQQ